MNQHLSSVERRRGPARRRRVLVGTLGAAVTLLTLPFARLAGAVQLPRKMRPQPGDILVFRFGAEKEQPVAPDRIPLGTEMVQALAMDLATGVIRDGSRLNGILLVRLDRTQPSEATQTHAADGFTA